MSEQLDPNIKFLRRAPLFSILTAVIISIIKLYSWFSTDSASIMASLIDSLLDLSTSIINFIALRAALVPPDHNHRFGHNKIEDLAVFGQSVGFFASGIFIFYNSVHHITSSHTIESTVYTMRFLIKNFHRMKAFDFTEDDLKYICNFRLVRAHN